MGQCYTAGISGVTYLHSLCCTVTELSLQTQRHTGQSI